MRFQLLFKQKCIGHPKLSHIKRLSEVLKPNKIWKFLTKFDIWRDHSLWVVTKSYSPKLGEQLGGRLSPGMHLACHLDSAREELIQGLYIEIGPGLPAQESASSRLAASARPQVPTAKTVDLQQSSTMTSSVLTSTPFTHWTISVIW